ncbi:hypothetical protein A9Q84_20865 [Halobacteriovorax marinus]|uniref:RNA 2-O ribose methyltransferase substrate binding domain-containing protein n=1 Tax=Halobacteriovorax marinus TaxID=97084 RepID=A0A1Y5F7U9_9BACT|nr:hypothetical protein A9Q84_20865 [Halobacteriovorax marinus]
MKFELIESIDDERIKEFLSLKDKALKVEDLIVVETEKVIRKLLNSDVQVLKVFGTEEYLNKFEKEISDNSIEVFTANKALMENIVGHNLHQGFMALAKRPQYVSLQELGDKILIFNGLSSPENVGTMIRNSSAFNINSIIVDYKTCSPYMRRCIRVSMGNIFKVKVHFTNNLRGTLKELQDHDYQIISTANQEGAIDLPKFAFPKKGAVIIGSEGHGIESGILEQSDTIVRIPINEEVAHLNAACSSSIFLYQFSL